MRSAGSHGPWDVVAWDWDEIKYIQVKRDCDPTKKEIEEMCDARIPIWQCPHCGYRGTQTSKEIWRWNTRDPEPKVRIL